MEFAGHVTKRTCASPNSVCVVICGCGCKCILAQGIPEMSHCYYAGKDRATTACQKPLEAHSRRQHKLPSPFTNDIPPSHISQTFPSRKRISQLEPLTQQLPRPSSPQSSQILPSHKSNSMCLSIQAQQVTMNSIPPLYDNNAPLSGSSPPADYTDLRFAATSASSLPAGFSRFSEDSSASDTNKTKKSSRTKSSRSLRSPRKKPVKASSSRSIKSNGSTSNTTNDDDRPKRPLSAYSKYTSIDSDVVLFNFDSIHSDATSRACANISYAFS